MPDSAAAPVNHPAPYCVSWGKALTGWAEGACQMRFTGVLRIIGAILLLAIGGIHLFLVASGQGGLLVVPFVLNGIAGVVLAIGLLVLRGRLLLWASVLALLFAVASLLALVLALTVGLFGIHEHWTFTLVPQTVVVDAAAIVVLAVLTARMLGARSRATVAEPRSAVGTR